MPQRLPLHQSCVDYAGSEFHEAYVDGILWALGCKTKPVVGIMETELKIGIALCLDSIFLCTFLCVCHVLPFTCNTLTTNRGSSTTLLFVLCEAIYTKF